MDTADDHREDVSLAIIGSGGAGALTVGALLLETAARAGWYGMMTRSVGPQIRGGESAALLRLSTRPVECMDARYDLVIAMDWNKADRLLPEIPLAGDGICIGDPAGGEIPAMLAAAGVEPVGVAMKDLAGEIPGGRPNMIALGLAGGLLDLPPDRLMDEVGRKLAGKGEAAIGASRQAIGAGYDEAGRIGRSLALTSPAGDGSGRWLISGNEAAGLGAVRGGVRFVAAYPITPATEILEWLAPALARTGGALLQAEDELASINMIIGASFGGKAALTATSGPGLALMIESLGLATAAEIPVVVVDVMRGGPSTGIPTKSEQSDLNIAVHGCHGDAPHIVVAPLSVGDCLFTTQWAVHLAEATQSPAIVLSDQALGQARAVIDRPADVAFLARREVATPVAGEVYRRYALTASGVSPMALPGTPGGQYTADGLTHTETGIPSGRAADHTDQLDKRRAKIENFDYGDHWAVAEGEGELAIVTWGSVTGAAREAVRRLAGEGIGARLLALRLIAPFSPERFLEALDGVRRLLVVEQTHSGQFHRYLRSECDLPGEVRALYRPGPQPLGPEEICAAARRWSSP